MKIIAARPQACNEKDTQFNDDVLKALVGCEDVQLVNVCTDGVGYEAKWQRELLVNVFYVPIL